MISYPEFADIKQFYDWGCYTDDDIRTYVELGCITPNQFTEITGKPYAKEETPSEGLSWPSDGSVGTE